ncbi:MAG: glycosyltransferase [Phycisphaerales bacterium]|jgi:cellulose synthase/poly-beta-1,6-N-acetylglucosamine synthase-like glycosyltransferase|nr:glycosyltransferase [Phycisphaerales bacterium]MBT7171906.1 glycosyltransferase [Phycisphaerales bacterium]
MTGLWILNGFCALAGLIWWTRHQLVNSEQRDGQVIRPTNPGPDGPDAPRISVCVAARDEADCIEVCVRSFLAQDYPDFQVIAVNDRSGDATGEILDRIAAEDDRLTVIHVTDLPEGWKGKPHAMHLASQQADGELLLFTDADCHQDSARTLAVTAEEFRRQPHCGMLTMLPELEMVGFWEKLLQPVCSGVMMIWFKPDKVNDPNRSHAYANGAFMLFGRECYDEIGTHEAIKHELQEDMEIAKLVKHNSSGRLVVRRAEGLYRVRMYTNLREICNGWVRIFFGTFHSLPKLIVSFLLVFLMGPVPITTLLLGWFLTGPAATWALIVGAVAMAGQMSLIGRYYHMIRNPLWVGLLYPPASVMACGLLVAAMTRHLPGKEVQWKSTAYTKDDVAKE